MSKIQNNAITQAKKHENSKQTAAARLASGKQINRASEGAAELAASAKLTASARSLTAATSNARRALSLGQIGDGGLSQIQDEVVRIKELAVAAASDTFDVGDRAKAQAEINKRIETVDFIVKSTRFGDSVLLNGTGGDGSGNFKFQVGEKAITGEEDLQTLDLSAKYDTATLNEGNGFTSANLKIDSIEDALLVVNICDTVIGEINTGRSNIGAFMAGMESTINVNDVKGENVQGAVDVFMSADIAKEATNLALAEIRSQMAQAMVSRENQAEQNIISLVR